MLEPDPLYLDPLYLDHKRHQGNRELNQFLLAQLVVGVQFGYEIWGPSVSTIHHLHLSQRSVSKQKITNKHNYVANSNTAFNLIEHSHVQSCMLQQKKLNKLGLMFWVVVPHKAVPHIATTKFCSV